MLFDYIIVGAGPSGATIAYYLQKEGASCLIVDKKAKIEEKTCGGLLTWSGICTLKNIGFETHELLEYGASCINSFLYNEGNRCKLYSYKNGEYGLGITRKILDQWILNHAIVFGAKIQWNMIFKDIVKKDEIFKVGNNSAKKIILATGANGFLPLNMKHMIKNQTFGMSAQIKGKTNLQEDKVMFYIIGENEYDYFWVIPNGNQIWNIGVWFQNVPSNAIEIFWKYKKKIVDRYFENISFVRTLQGGFCGNVNFAQHLTNGCYGIGDFAGQNRINTGEGIRYALDSAVILAERLLKEK